MTASNKRHITRAVSAWLVILAIYAAPMSAFAQTRISLRPNRYKVSDDVQAGRQAAAEVERQLPLLRDGYVDNYIDRIGRQLVNAIPSEFQHPEFRYTFTVVNVRDVNAFALPGGPMYGNRGLIDIAHNEGELAGVMAHELSHVALRHGTVQATKAQKYGLLAGVAGIVGTILGGPA
ncbi:MAG: M48 family metalloprotease, partial [Pyrinomonadaceae bacterium]|nr:M48 family metalloprotease [Pyrinomonadaceae bacterium]